MQWYVKAFRQYADFHGRARRTEYWMFALFNLVALIVTIVLDNLTGLTFPGLPYGALYTVYALAVVIPSLALGARRLHDTDRSGWWQLLSLIPIVGAIIVIVFFATDGQPGVNSYGPDPKAATLTET